jgi:hypothetical protein
MNYHKYMKDLLHYQYVQGQFEDMDDLLIIAA